MAGKLIERLRTARSSNVVMQTTLRVSSRPLYALRSKPMVVSSQPLEVPMRAW